MSSSSSSRSAAARYSSSQRSSNRSNQQGRRESERSRSRDREQELRERGRKQRERGQERRLEWADVIGDTDHSALVDNYMSLLLLQQPDLTRDAARVTANAFAEMHFSQQYRMATTAQDRGLNISDLPAAWHGAARRTLIPATAGGSSQQTTGPVMAQQQELWMHQFMQQQQQLQQQQQVGMQPWWMQQQQQFAPVGGMHHFVQRMQQQQILNTPASDSESNNERRFARIESAIAQLAGSSPAPMRQPNFDGAGGGIGYAPALLLPPATPAHVPAYPAHIPAQQHAAQPLIVGLPGPLAPPGGAAPAVNVAHPGAGVAGPPAGGPPAPAGGAGPTLVQALSALSKQALEVWRARVNEKMKRAQFSAWYDDPACKDLAIQALAGLLTVKMTEKNFQWTTLAALDAENWA